jgi:hypothetical protein
MRDRRLRVLALIAVVVALGLVVWHVVADRSQYDGNVTIQPDRVVPEYSLCVVAADTSCALLTVRR